MKKIDKTLREVRRWKRKSSAKTKGMTHKQVVAFFHAAHTEAEAYRRKHRVA